MLYEDSLEAIREEELREKRELYRGVHKPLKLWYAKANDVIRNKYGELPEFWQDLESWPHSKALVKLYLTLEEKKQAGEPVDEVALEAKLFSATSDSVKQSGEAGQQPKKKRNRWGDPDPNATTEPSTSISTDTLPTVSTTSESVIMAQSCANSDSIVTNPTTQQQDGKKPRRSRWAPPEPEAAQIAANLVALNQEIAQQTIILNVKLQHISEKLITVVQDAARIELDPDRSPSPPPRYDSNGKRTNTREIRMREELMKERTKVIEELIRVNPSYIPPPDYVRQKPFRKLYIPIREFPTYNFIGLLIGPRGNTQREMEQESGCKISIRGKGSVKDGRAGRNAKNQIDEDDELHVHIQGDTELAVERAVVLVNRILTPVDDEKNEHKQKQLRELALINGTLREDEFCPICGERGHRQFECTNRTQSFKAANVKCAICGDLSHPTRDCPFKDTNQQPETVTIDQEYSSFMAELDGSKSAQTVKTSGTSSEPIRGQSVIQSAISTTTTSTQQTIVMPAIADPLTTTTNQYAPVWNGVAYVTPTASNPYLPANPYAYYPPAPHDAYFNPIPNYYVPSTGPAPPPPAPWAPPPPGPR